VKSGTWLDNPKSKIQQPCYEVRVTGDDIQVAAPEETVPTAP
jgi:hypothetical protein